MTTDGNELRSLRHHRALAFLELRHRRDHCARGRLWRCEPRPGFRGRVAATLRSAVAPASSGALPRLDARGAGARGPDMDGPRVPDSPRSPDVALRSGAARTPPPS